MEKEVNIQQIDKLISEHEAAIVNLRNKMAKKADVIKRKLEKLQRIKNEFLIEVIKDSGIDKLNNDQLKMVVNNVTNNCIE